MTPEEDLLARAERAEAKIEAAMGCVEEYGGIDGGHHKTWVIDQVARALKGDRYDAWVVAMKDGYDEGIAP